MMLFAADPLYMSFSIYQHIISRTLLLVFCNCFSFTYWYKYRLNIGSVHKFKLYFYKQYQERPFLSKAYKMSPVSRIIRLLQRQYGLSYTYILCHFNFCPLVWHFCSQLDTDKLESPPVCLFRLRK